MYIPNFSISRQYPQSMRNLKDLFYASIEVTIGIYRNAFIQKMGYGVAALCGVLLIASDLLRPIFSFSHFKDFYSSFSFLFNSATFPAGWNSIIITLFLQFCLS